MDTLVILCFSFVFGFLGLLVFLLYRATNSPEPELSSSTDEDQPTPSSSRSTNQNELRVGSKVIKSRNSKTPVKKSRPDADNLDDQSDDGTNLEHNTTASTSFSAADGGITGKIGKKKLQKLEMKAEKKAAREQEAQLREEKKLQKEKEDEIQQRLEEEREAREREREEEEKRLIAEQKQREYEQYLKAKQAFVVEEEGFDSSQDTDQQNKLVDFINYIKEKKIVMLEELAGEFKMRTQDVITRVNELLDTEQIEGVIDDRGKFIYITQDELDSVAKFIKQNGRVSITDLVENSNRLILLNKIAN